MISAVPPQEFNAAAAPSYVSTEQTANRQVATDDDTNATYDRQVVNQSNLAENDLQASNLDGGRHFNPSVVEMSQLRPLRASRLSSLPTQLSLPPASQSGHQYTYNEQTGLLVHTGKSLGDGGIKDRKQYVEDAATGRFHKVQIKTGTRFRFFQRPQKTQQAWQHSRADTSSLKSVIDSVSNTVGVIILFAQGVLGGLALLNLFMIYVLGLPDWNGDLTDFMTYYGPLAMLVNRMYYGLISLSIIAACTRSANNAITNYEPKQLQTQLHDGLVIACYIVAYIVSVLCTPMDDELTYSYNRDNRFWETQQLSSRFTERLKLWHFMNFLRLAACVVAWALVCYQLRPSMHDTIIMTKVHELLQEQLSHTGEHQGNTRSGSSSPAPGSPRHQTATIAVPGSPSSPTASKYAPSSSPLHPLPSIVPISANSVRHVAKLPGSPVLAPQPQPRSPLSPPLRSQLQPNM